jgi:hypothetical protein
MEKIFIGFKNNHVINSKDTFRQVLKLKKLKLNLHHEDGQDVQWLDIYDSSNPRSIIQAIILDRRRRVDYKSIMADRPSTCVVTINNDSIDRIEYYEGHDGLKLIYDIRSKSLQGVQLESSYKEEQEIMNSSYGIRSFTNKPQIGIDYAIFCNLAHEKIIKREKDDKLLYYARNTETLKEHKNNYEKALIGQVLNLCDIGGVER